jgi:hypothetical protein
MKDNIFHHRKHNTTQVEILSAQSNEVGSIKFTRVPDCHIEILEDHVDIATIYTGSGPSNKAFDWLLEHDDDDNGNTQIKDEFFLKICTRHSRLHFVQ